MGTYLDKETELEDRIERLEQRVNDLETVGKPKYGIKHESAALHLPVVMPRFSEITTESDDKAFSWILQNDTNADHPENNSDMIRRLVHKYNDLIKYLNGV